VASWLVHFPPDLVVQVSALSGALCCVLEQDTLFILTVPLSTQMYE